LNLFFHLTTHDFKDSIKQHSVIKKINPPAILGGKNNAYSGLKLRTNNFIVISVGAASRRHSPSNTT